MQQIKPDTNSMLELGTSFTLLRMKLQEAGYKIIQSSDFYAFQKICKKREGRPISELSNPESFELTNGNSFYLVAYDKKSAVAGTIACTYETIGRENLAQFLSRRLPRVVGGELGDFHAPGMYDVKGRIVYHGDLWVDQRHNGKTLGRLLPQLALLLAQSQFDPDFSYAFFAPRMVKSSRIIEMGYRSVHQRAIDWETVPEGFNEDFWLAYSSRDDLFNLAFNVCSQNARNEAS